MLSHNLWKFSKIGFHWFLTKILINSLASGWRPAPDTSAVLFRNLASPFHRSLGGTHWATLRMYLLGFPKKRQILRLFESTAVLFRNLASPFHRSLGGTHWATLRMDLLGFPKKRQTSTNPYFYIFAQIFAKNFLKNCKIFIKIIKNCSQNSNIL